MKRNVLAGRLKKSVLELLRLLVSLSALTAAILGCSSEEAASDSANAQPSLVAENSHTDAAADGATLADEAPLSPLEELVLRPWTGDLDGMLERGVIRILVPYSMTYFFQDGGRNRGIVAEAGEQLEKLFNKKFRPKRRLVVAFIPTSREQLLSGLIDGRGDISAGGITITETRAAQVAFSRPTSEDISEVVVAGPGIPELTGLADLSGMEIHVPRGSSFVESLEQLNVDLRSAGKTPVKISELDAALDMGDALEMVQAGLIAVTVADDVLANFWSETFPSLRVYDEMEVAVGRKYAWAFRQNSPKLEKALNDVVRTHRVGTTFGNVVTTRYLKSQRWVKNPKASKEWVRYNEVAPLFNKYGREYGFDDLLLLAQAFQESGLDHSVRSRAGAIGIMQLLPSTGKAMQVGDIRTLEVNVHAGAKYLRHLVDTYFADEGISEIDRTLFAFAAYNAGPNRIARLRRLTAKRGLDPDVWLGNVEITVGSRVGREPVVYVRNIYKYYLAYRRAQTLLKRKNTAKMQRK